ncbi:juvenile hormone acid O-methyltransferase-like [Odontomachus brunneus]|uniref:juvenile hormone acid O-methyltransferase-like n=1 Tax=Odontomachus brunneus TaxID=486640 RepID=UPI0013F2B11C|nr:juvenile hormone acid O-methyltransferase-like [Odontomachus brunneus]XP_032670648.1 juvenile hormone acid O-methyltransferase-like [Odontomachus brunneus]
MTNPTEYAKVNNLSHSVIYHLIREFEEELAHMSGKCIDIGCGPGDVTRYTLLPALDPKAVITGIDISEDMIRYAKKLCDDEQRLKFEALDIQTKHLPEKYVSEYDHMFTFHTLHWCDDIRQVFENIYCLLRPGGTILILTLVYHDVFDILYKLSQDIRYKPYITHVKNFIPPFYDSIQANKELKALLKSIGFNVLHCSHRERTYCAQDIQEYPTLILAFVTQFLKNMPHDRMEQFKDEFTREYKKRRFFHKQMRTQKERIASDLHEILVVYAKKISL